MLAKYYRPSKIRFRRCCTCRRRRGEYTYESLLRDSRSNGITVEAAQPCADAPRVCCEPENQAPAFCESGILRYKSWWERKESDVFVNGHVLTGIPVFMAPDALCVVSGDCSRFVPLEQVACIRTAKNENV